MDTKVSYREIDIENPQTGPKTASTMFFVGEWLEYASGLLAPLAPATPVVGLNIVPVPATDATTDLITFDGVNSTEDRFVMPLANTLTYTVTSGVFQVGDVVTGSISGATGVVIQYIATTHIVITAISGVFVIGDVITGSISGAIGTVTAVTAIAAVDIGQTADIAADFTSLDVSTIGSGTQFKITQIISPNMVEVAVVLLSL